MQLGWPNSHFLFPLWLLASLFSHLHPDISYSLQPTIWKPWGTSFWRRESVKQCARWMAWCWVVLGPASSYRLQVALPKVLSICLVWIFSRLRQLCFKYLTLHEDVLGFLKLFLWLWKEKKLIIQLKEWYEKTKMAIHSPTIFLVTLWSKNELRFYFLQQHCICGWLEHHKC